MLLENFVFGMAAVATTWVHEPASLRSLLLAWAPLWLIVGIGIAGPVADRFGRKTTFYVTMGMYAVGAIGIAASDTYELILVFLAIAMAAAGGEMNTIMAATQEIMPTLHRSKSSLWEVNFINTGGIVLGAIALGTVDSQIAQRAALASMMVVAVTVLFIARRKTPESIRWLERTGRTEAAEREVERFFQREVYEARRSALAQTAGRERFGNRGANLPLQFAVAWTMAFANTTGYGLITYTLAPNFFASRTDLIVLVAAGAGFASGFVAFWADRLPRRGMLLTGFAGALLFAVLFWIFRGAWTSEFWLFLLLMVLFYGFVNISYISEDTFKSEIWPSEKRATMLAIVRFTSIGAYIGMIFVIQHLTFHGALILNGAVWLFGLCAAVVWRIFGRETGAGTAVSVSSLER